MDDWCPTGVFADILGRVFAAHINPAGIQFGLQQVSRDFLIIGIQNILTVDLGKLKIMVMVQKLDAPVFASLSNLAETEDVAVQLRFILGGRYPGNGNELHAGCRVIIQCGIVLQRINGNMGANQFQPHLIQDLLAGHGGPHAVQTGKLHAIVAHFLQAAHGSFKILGCFVPDGINLNRDWPFFHINNLHIDYASNMTTCFFSAEVIIASIRRMTRATWGSLIRRSSLPSR